MANCESNSQYSKNNKSEISTTKHFFKGLEFTTKLSYKHQRPPTPLGESLINKIALVGKIGVTLT